MHGSPGGPSSLALLLLLRCYYGRFPMGRTGKKYLGASVRETEVRALKKKRKPKEEEEEEEEFFAGRVDLSLSSFPSFAVIALLSHIIRPPFLLLLFRKLEKSHLPSFRL